MIIKPKVRGYVCVTTHPVGCAVNVRQQIGVVRDAGTIAGGPKHALVIGASTGYGLGSRITASFGCGAATTGVFFERPPQENRPATAGWYNSAAFHEAAAAQNLYARSFNGDAYSTGVKERVVASLREAPAPVDLVVYSLAAPKRTHPVTGVTHSSVLKPIGAPYTGKTVDTDCGVVTEVTIPRASDAEVRDTIAVMGGEDWEMWMDALADGGVLADGVRTVAFTYIGPKITWPVYWDGTIGQAKKDLERAAHALNNRLATNGGAADVAVMKAVVTQASSAIPVVPLYISVLFGVMKEKGLHEGCVEQAARLFSDRMYNDAPPDRDGQGRIRMDDWEMRDDVQAAVDTIWPQITTANLRDLTDFAGYQEEFMKLFGFGLGDVDYDADVDPLVTLEA